MSPEDIAASMTGRIRQVSATRGEAFLPSPMVQNHAAFLHLLEDGTLLCAWFAGSLEGKSDIAIHASMLPPGGQVWGAPQRLSHDPDRSEQNPVIFAANGGLLLFHTSQPAGNQDQCRIRMVALSRDPSDSARLIEGEARYLDELPRGCFVRGPVTLRADGAWLLPLFLCVPQPGTRWNGSHDLAAVAVSTDRGASWQIEAVPDSLGSVHMSPVTLPDGTRAAFFRRRQADAVHRSVSTDDGRHWSAPRPTDLPNNNSSIAATLIADGRVAVICNPVSAADSQARRQSLYDELETSDDRPDAQGGCQPVWGVPRAPLAVCLSADGGQTFPQRIVIEDGPGNCLSNNSTDGHNQEMSYPWLLEDPDGSLHIAYTYHRRAIKYVRLAPGWAAANRRE